MKIHLNKSIAEKTENMQAKYLAGRYSVERFGSVVWAWAGLGAQWEAAG
jgi:hypothetical protein